MKCSFKIQQEIVGSSKNTQKFIKKTEVYP